jgi:anti-sigma regulatory factor (Ser/Thr protein kinase)
MSEHERDPLVMRSVRLPAQRERYFDLVNVVEAFGHETDIERRPEWHEFLTAVSEIGANVLSYAYPVGNMGEIELDLLRYPDRIEARLRDWGAPFVEQPVTSPPAGDDLLDSILDLEESGRGLAIARLALSSIGYERASDGTNTWTLVKAL